ncbi:COG4223 family protein [Methyloferula stellata]|uniref:COG4223 family protein n=1 Tax=Methyloferula stellata TaxID=876270 RepID=UPI000374251E|nr:hypothetical protein [Methyloferula stellata]
MAGHDETGSDANREPGPDSVTPFGTPSPLHREKPTIEGEAIHVPEAEAEKPASPEPLAEVKLAMEELLAGDEHPTDHEAAASAEAHAEAAASNGAVPPHVAPPPHRGFSFFAIILVALIGAATGFASAYVARLFLDDSQKTFAALDQRISAMNAKLDADQRKIDTANASSRDLVSSLEKRIGAVEKSASDALGLAKAAQAQAQQVQSAAPSDTSAPATVDLAPVQSRIDALEHRIGQLEAALNAPKSAVRAPQEPEAKPDPQAVNAPAIAIIAENLTQKIASGAPFTTELAALEKLGADKAKLAVLQPAAGKGIVTTKALADQFAALTPALLATEKPASPPDENVFDRLMSHAAGLVRVRKLNDLSGEDLPARVARVKDALAHDDLDRALQERATFPEAAKTASAAWAEAAKARVATLAAAKGIAADAMANLVKVKS